MCSIWNRFIKINILKPKIFNIHYADQKSCQYVNYYTDISYSPRTKIGVLGFMKEFDVPIFEKVYENNSTNCEILSCIKTIEYAINIGDNNIVIYTDYIGIINILKKTKHNNMYHIKLYDIYKKFQKDGNIIIKKIKGHPKKIETTHDKNFSIVDKITREIRKKLET
jgi:ribonuclease HI